MRFISVDLPEPDGPMIATYSLRRMARSTPRSARTISPPMSYSRLMPRVTITQSLPGVAPAAPTTACRSAVVLSGASTESLHDVLAHVFACWLLGVVLRLADQRAILQLADRLIGAGDDLARLP